MRVTLADDIRGETGVEIHVVGRQPQHPPYLRIGYLADGRFIASVSHANALRGLAHRILRALGDE